MEIDGEAVVKRIDIAGDSANLIIQLPIKNVGAQPAFNVGMWASEAIFPTPIVIVNGRSEQLAEFNRQADRTCIFATAFANTKQDLGPLIFPGHSFIENRQVKASLTDGILRSILVVGCITYGDQSGNQHQTRFCFINSEGGPVNIDGHLRYCIFNQKAN
jgi:hypothetical protein